MKHVPGNKHLVADAMSRRPRQIEDSTDDENNAEEFLDLRCGGVSIFSTHIFEETEADSIDDGRNLLELVTLYNCSSAMSLYS